MEKWRSLLWKKVFPFCLSENASPRFLKVSELLKFDGGILAGHLFYRFVCFHFLLDSVFFLSLSLLLIVMHIFRYIKQELITKRAFAAWEVPTHIELKLSTLTPIEELWSKDQRNRFAHEVLLTGGWFLECPPNIVHEEEKHLVPLPEPSARGAAPIVTDLDDDEEAFQVEPTPKPKVQRRGQVRSRDGSVVAATHAGVQILERAPLASTQTSHRTVSNPPSPRRSNLDVESSQPLRVTQSGHGVPPPKAVGIISSSPFKISLPMFLEHGNFCGLLNQSEHQQFMDPKLVRIVDHIIKVIPYNMSPTLSIWNLSWNSEVFLLSVTHTSHYSYSYRSVWDVFILVSRCKCGLDILKLISCLLMFRKTWSCLSSPPCPYHPGQTRVRLL